MWPSWFLAHIKEWRWPQNKTGVVHRYQATVLRCHRCCVYLWHVTNNNVMITTLIVYFLIKVSLIMSIASKEYGIAIFGYLCPLKPSNVGICTYSSRMFHTILYTTLQVQPLKFGNGWRISSHTLLNIRLIILCQECRYNRSVSTDNKTQQSMNHVQDSWDGLFTCTSLA